MNDSVALIVPCFNEASRLDQTAFLEIVDAEPHLILIFVNDGSGDGTSRVLDKLATTRPSQISALELRRNAGKGEAVRQGLLHALKGSTNVAASAAGILGYLDADLATPPNEIRRLITLMRSRPDLDVLLGARVGLLGREVERRLLRHYFGRVFATAASVLLHVRVYDTQCGAKLFRRRPSLAAALSEPFLSRWAFDVELIGRLLIGSPYVNPVSITAVREEPLLVWRDAGDSRLTPRQVGMVPPDLIRVWHDLGRRRSLQKEASLAAVPNAKADTPKAGVPAETAQLTTALRAHLA